VAAAGIKVKELDGLGSQGYTDSYGRAFETIPSGGIDPSPMASHELPFEDPSAGLDLLDDRSAKWRNRHDCPKPNAGRIC